MPVAAQESGEAGLAPLNPAFLEYLQGSPMIVTQQQTADGHVPGFIPSPVELSHLAGLSLPHVQELVGAPASYDLRLLGKLTPVKDQGPCGSCWTFATYGSLESNLLTSETWDFSENDLKDTHGFDPGYCDGGNAFMSTAYLARWSGPVSEADDPYNPSSGYSPSGLVTQKHVQEVLIIPNRTGPLDNENIKQAVMTYGAAYTAIYWSDSRYNSTYGTYYYRGTGSSNHAVAIVGWDDNFDRTKFLYPYPANNGAFIIKNSWGTSFGENGYFYISYYDKKIGYDENFMFNDAESFTNYTSIYQYDPLGWTQSLGYSVNTGWFANIFTAAAGEQLSAVSFYTASPNSTYEVYIYDGVTSVPTSGSLQGTRTGIIPAPGYHTIVLDSSVSLTAGQKFSVVVKLTTPGYNYPIPLEYPYAGYSSSATANAGESFVSSNGSSWSDITSSYPKTNVCVKAFAINGSVCKYSISPMSESFSASGGTGSVNVTTQSECSWTATSNVPWIIVTSGSSGMGTGAVEYSVEVNTGSSRTGTMTVAGRTFTVNQSAAGSSITVTSPNDGTENWQTGTAHAITWTYTGNPGAYVKIVLLKGGVSYGTISKSTLTANGSFSWKIPLKVAAANNYRIKIISTTNKSFKDMSNKDFSIFH
jgi:C1A family cysteine protease